MPTVLRLLTLALALVSPPDTPTTVDGWARMTVQGHVGYDVVLDEDRLEGMVYYREVQSPAALEATADGWRGTVAGFDVVASKTGDASFELELTPIFGDERMPSPMPRKPYPTRYQFEVARHEGGWTEYRGWSGIRDRGKLHARVSTDEGRLWLTAGDGESDRTLELRRDAAGDYRGTRLDLVESSGTIPHDRVVRLTSAGALDPASVLEDDPLLFSLVYIVFPTLPQFTW